jgi:predicted transcriptional regulator
MRCQFVLDKQTHSMLEELAETRAGNRSFVVREAIRLYAAYEFRLDELEKDSGFLRMMESTEAAIRDGRTLTHAEVKKRTRRLNRKK